MQLYQIKSSTKNKKKKRIGRGGKKGTYSGKGKKGQRSRAGAKIRPELRDLVKKIPKLRGYKFKTHRKKRKKQAKIIKISKQKTRNKIIVKSSKIKNNK